MRLLYHDTKFKPKTDDYLGMIEFKTEKLNNLRTPYAKSLGGIKDYGYPFGGKGFPLSKNRQIVPESAFQDNIDIEANYFVDILDGAKLFLVERKGNKILAAIFEDGKFVSRLGGK